jgi:pilus assembly protein CpaB
MRANTFVMIGLAVLFGGLAVMASQTWLSQQADAQRRSIEASVVPAGDMMTLVVARRALSFGTELGGSVLKEIPWPGDQLPEGGFATVESLEVDGKRVALAPFQSNEPIIASRITGPGQRATLSAVIEEGMRAVTVRVDDVFGVAGFVLPGDRVDVVLTREGRDGAGAANTILQGIKVLAVDQSADQNVDEPDVVKAVTLEVDSNSAQKLALAQSVGTISLVLRRAGEAHLNNVGGVTVADLAPEFASFAPAAGDGEGEAAAPALDGRLATVWVTGKEGRQAHRVPRE